MSSIAIAGGSGGRSMLIANTTYYVATTGSDSNPGTIGSPWATVQHAVDFLGQNIDGAGFTITVQIEDGTYAGFTISSLAVNVGVMIVQGNTGDATKVVITDTVFGFLCILVQGAGAPTQISDMTLQISGSGNECFAPNDIASNLFLNNIIFNSPGVLRGNSAIDFFIGVASLVLGQNFSGSSGNMQIIGNWNYFLKTDGTTLSYIDLSGNTWTLTGPPDFSKAFVFLDPLTSMVIETGPTFSGAATGQRFDNSGFITPRGGGALSLTRLPGNANGVLHAGALYGDIAGSGPSTTVAGLPAVGIVPVGQRAFVTDAAQTLAANLGGIVVGLGANSSPVYSDGADWRQG